MSKMNIMDVLARKKAGMGEDWHPYLYRFLPEDSEVTQVIEITGSVPRLLKRGPRKGQRTWRDADPATRRTVYLTPDELAAAEQRP